MTGAAVPAADVGEMGVGYGVPAVQWRCLGGAGWCRRAFGAERRGRGQRRRWRDDVAGAFWSVPVHALSCACTFWARLGVTFLVHVVHHLVEQGVEGVQGSV
jgi:hypothetical protein